MIEEPFKKPPPSGDFQPPPKPKRYWWRFTLASVVIVIVTAAATAASILLYVGSIANALSHNNILQNKVERYPRPDPRRRTARTSSSSAPTNGPANPKIPAAPTRRSCCGSIPTGTRSR